MLGDRKDDRKYSGTHDSDQLQVQLNRSYIARERVARSREGLFWILGRLYTRVHSTFDKNFVALAPSTHTASVCLLDGSLQVN